MSHDSGDPSADAAIPEFFGRKNKIFFLPLFFFPSYSYSRNRTYSKRSVGKSMGHFVAAVVTFFAVFSALSAGQNTAVPLDNWETLSSLGTWLSGNTYANGSSQIFVFQSDPEEEEITVEIRGDSGVVLFLRDSWFLGTDDYQGYSKGVACPTVFANTTKALEIYSPGNADLSYEIKVTLRNITMLPGVVYHGHNVEDPPKHRGLRQYAIRPAAKENYFRFFFWVVEPWAPGALFPRIGELLLNGGACASGVFNVPDDIVINYDPGPSDDSVPVIIEISNSSNPIKFQENNTYYAAVNIIFQTVGLNFTYAVGYCNYRNCTIADPARPPPPPPPLPPSSVIDESDTMRSTSWSLTDRRFWFCLRFFFLLQILFHAFF